MPHPGDTVRISTAASTEEGILMPSLDEKVVLIKLKNGYNLGFEKKEIKEMIVLEEKKERKKPHSAISKTKALPTIAILHTGGTIASKVDYATGAVTAKFTAEDTLELFPELSQIANIETELIANLMSEDLDFLSYQKIAHTVKKWAEKKVKGIIIGHGTDTLGYTAAALSFMFEKINLPVLLVGSQRSTDRGSSDGAMNLVCAAEFIVQSNFCGVAVCMHHSSSDDLCAILPGTKTRKMHTSRRDAFKAVNAQPLALIDYNTRKITFLEKNFPQETKLVLKDKFSPEVGLLKTHPQMKPELFEFFTNNYKAFVIEGTGLGHAPTNVGADNLKNYEHLKKFIEKGGIVAITSQCIFGAVHPYVYTNLRRLSEIGCIFCEDMLPETAFIKLAWLLGNYPSAEAKKLLITNLRGEINTTRTYEADFLNEEKEVPS